MNGDDQQNLLLSNEMSQHKKHKKRTKNLLLQLKDQVIFFKMECVWSSICRPQ